MTPCSRAVVTRFGQEITHLFVVTEVSILCSKYECFEHRKNWIQPISALNCFYKICVTVVSSVILICLEIYRPNPFLYSIFPPFLLHRFPTTPSWIGTHNVRNYRSGLKIRSINIANKSPPPHLKGWIQFFSYPRLLLRWDKLPSPHKQPSNITTGDWTLNSSLSNILHSLIISLSSQRNLVHNLIYFDSNVFIFRNVRNIRTSLFKTKLNVLWGLIRDILVESFRLFGITCCSVFRDHCSPQKLEAADSSEMYMYLLK